MKMFSLDEPPINGIPTTLWRTGVPGDVAVGDLWLLSWDREALGLAVISGRYDGFVLAWPVTTDMASGHAPAIRLEGSPLGIPVDAWPTRETGVSDVVLHRRLGRLLQPPIMALIADSLDEGTSPPAPFAYPQTETSTQDTAEAMVDHWGAICAISWPTELLAATLDRTALKAAGITPSLLADVLDLPPVDAVSIAMGEKELTPDQISGLMGVLPEGVVLFDESTAAGRPGVAEISAPRWKQAVVDITRRLAIPEAEVRDHFVAEYALAARSNSTDDRIKAALARVASPGEGA